MPSKSKYAGLVSDNNKSRTHENLNPDETALGALARAILRTGGAVLFATTRDGSAVRVILFDGDNKDSHYFGTDDELEQFCTAMAQAAERMLS